MYNAISYLKCLIIRAGFRGARAAHADRRRAAGLNRTAARNRSRREDGKHVEKAESNGPLGRPVCVAGADCSGCSRGALCERSGLGAAGLDDFQPGGAGADGGDGRGCGRAAVGGGAGRDALRGVDVDERGRLGTAGRRLLDWHRVQTQRRYSGDDLLLRRPRLGRERRRRRVDRVRQRDAGGEGDGNGDVQAGDEANRRCDGSVCAGDDADSDGDGYNDATVCVGDRVGRRRNGAAGANSDGGGGRRPDQAEVECGCRCGAVRAVDVVGPGYGLATA